MRIDEYARHDALGLASLIRRREISPQDAIDCAVGAIEAFNPKLNAIVELFDDRRRGGDPEANLAGRFGGVPFFLKDLGAGEQGRKSEMGSRIFRGFVADKTSFLTMRFKRAGLVNLGRTVLSYMVRPALRGKSSGSIKGRLRTYIRPVDGEAYCPWP
jgi:amidase